MKSALVLTVLAGLCSLGLGQEFKAGEEVELEFGGAVKPLIVRLPDNYTAEKKWPVVFHYHGTGGVPTVNIPLRYTEGREFVLVGMEYITLGNEAAARKRDYLEIEIEYLRKVRDHLAGRIAIDPKRSYVGGFSKGGWFGSEYAEVHAHDFAGAYVLGAGKRHPDRRPTRAISGKMPVFIGIGQRDINYIYSVAAIAHFKKLGARVTYDEFLNQGHTIPLGRKISEKFRQWWAIEGGRTAPGEVRAAAAEWGEGLEAELAQLESEMDRYLFLRHRRSLPFFALLPAEVRKSLDQASTALNAAPELKAELAAKREYDALLKRELSDAGMEHLLEVVFEYAELYARSAETHYGKRAGMEVMRLADQIKDFGRWRFSSEAEKAKVTEQLERKPLPEVDREALATEFGRLRGFLE